MNFAISLKPNLKEILDYLYPSVLNERQNHYADFIARVNSDGLKVYYTSSNGREQISQILKYNGPNLFCDISPEVEAKFKIKDSKGNIESIKLKEVFTEINELSEYLKYACDLHSTRSKKEPAILEKREEVLREYLKKHSNCAPQASFQEMYRSIGSPTQKEVLTALNELAPSLFKINANTKKPHHNFFADQTVIMFQTGTGKSR